MRSLPLIAICLAFSSVSASAVTIKNGDFETGLTDWVATGTVGPVNGQAYQNVTGTIGSGAQLTNVAAYFGGANLASTNTLSQSFSTIAGLTYNFSFDAFAVGAGTQAISYNIGGVSGSITPPSANNYNIFSTVTGSFIGTGGLLSAFFSNSSVGGDNLDVGIDNVSVAAVPEPTVWAMLIGGFGVAGTALRRRRAVVA